MWKCVMIVGMDINVKFWMIVVVGICIVIFIKRSVIIDW